MLPSPMNSRPASASTANSAAPKKFATMIPSMFGTMWERTMCQRPSPEIRAASTKGRLRKATITQGDRLRSQHPCAPRPAGDRDDADEYESAAGSARSLEVRGEDD